MPPARRAISCGFSGSSLNVVPFCRKSQPFGQGSAAAVFGDLQGLLRLAFAYQEMDVVVVDAGSVGGKWQRRFLVLQRRSRGFEGAQCGSILLVREVGFVFVFVELSERMLGLPLQEDVALRILFNLAKDLFRLLRVVHAGRNVSLDQHGIEHIERVAVCGARAIVLSA